MNGILVHYIEIIAKGIEIAGIITIVIGAIIALIHFALDTSYKKLRQNLGKVILLGLEFLVAGDIIATVSIDPNLDQVLTLGLIVLIRIFLSMSLQIELEGKL